jgi:M3 family oligoendopeptidase
MNISDFGDYQLPAPTYEDVAAEYAEFDSALDGAEFDAAVAAVERWDALRRRLWSWSNLVNIRYQQDTQNLEYKRALVHRNELEPKLTNLAVGMKSRLLASPHRAALVERFGGHAFRLWECDVAAFDPAIEVDLVEQSKLETSYTELLASAKFEFQGKSLTLSEIAKFSEHPDRKVRHEAARLRWGWFSNQSEQLDAIFDALVRRRQAMAEKLGRENFIEVGYQRMQRIGYGQTEVERFRNQVREQVVPLAMEIRLRQAQRIGVSPLMAWDEGLHEPAGNPKPLGGVSWMIDRAAAMFAQVDPQIERLYLQMRAAKVLDVESRNGKGGGGFCEIVPSFGLPFIFASFNGTKQDVMIFTHEMGHAFQCYSSLSLALWEHVFPTCETCEIHSMGLEFLTWPQMDLFFGADAERFRRQHLTDRILFLPYGVAVDHFQHLIYANPTASPAQRAKMWQELERTYLPWRDYGDLAHGASGRFWQSQLHIYRLPFYYIDYALALTVALQLWELAARDQATAMEKYVALCRRGGELPFNELIEAVGLTSPFEEGCLAHVVERAKREL